MKVSFFEKYNTKVDIWNFEGKILNNQFTFYFSLNISVTDKVATYNNQCYNGSSNIYF